VGSVPRVGWQRCCCAGQQPGPGTSLAKQQCSPAGWLMLPPAPWPTHPPRLATDCPDAPAAACAPPLGRAGDLLAGLLPLAGGWLAQPSKLASPAAADAALSACCRFTLGEALAAADLSPAPACRVGSVAALPCHVSKEMSVVPAHDGITQTVRSCMQRGACAGYKGAGQRLALPCLLTLLSLLLARARGDCFAADAEPADRKQRWSDSEST
jgi:hypothetical protein